MPVGPLTAGVIRGSNRVVTCTGTKLEGVVKMDRFFRDLYDFSFHDFVFPRIIKVIYVIGLALLGIGALIFVIGSFAQSVGMGLLTLLILAPLGFVLYSILMRIYLEIAMVLFRINEGIERQTAILTGQVPEAGGNLPETGAGPEQEQPQA
ncbi:MAG: DUF4282 domain-containing protein [Solirubrobacterales bacterium]|nr:DUF4282 domain-containing protein [Solirubrobacterales bacterium]